MRAHGSKRKPVHAWYIKKFVAQKEMDETKNKRERYREKESRKNMMKSERTI